MKTAKELREIANKKRKHYHCPVNAWDCPYYSDSPESCICTIDSPFNECDDFYNIWAGAASSEYTDYYEE